MNNLVNRFWNKINKNNQSLKGRVVAGEEVGVFLGHHSVSHQIRIFRKEREIVLDLPWECQLKRIGDQELGGVEEEEEAQFYQDHPTEIKTKSSKATMTQLGETWTINQSHQWDPTNSSNLKTQSKSNLASLDLLLRSPGLHNTSPKFHPPPNPTRNLSSNNRQLHSVNKTLTTKLPWLCSKR